MNLENRTTYLTAEVQRVHIAGAVYGEYAASFAWSISGDWYERSTGRFISWNHSARAYEPLARGSWRNITSKADDQSFWRGVELWRLSPGSTPR